MKPFRTFIFFAAVMLLLTLLALLVPEEGIGLGSDFKLSFINLSELSERNDGDGEDPAGVLLAGSGVTDDPESDDYAAILPDTLPAVEAAAPPVKAANSDSLREFVHSITFPGAGEEMLAPFFNHLEGIAEGRSRHTRILHFGDSQIEIDRMTALIRYRMQKHFGGSGVGLVQAIPLYSGSMSYQQEESGEWLRYTYFGRRDTTIMHNSYGIMGAFSAVPPPIEGEWPSLYYRFNQYRRSGRVSRIRVFLHSYVDSASVAFRVNDTIADTLRNLPAGFSVADYRHHEEVKDLSLSFDLKEGGRIYGISFESNTGVKMDNIAMRGGSGLIFSRMNRSSQQMMLDELSPGLILLQYGGNVVPYMDPGYYKRAFIKQLRFFRETCPGVPVIVIGPSDMSVREEGKFVTYPGLEPIRDALLGAAMVSGCAFWDLYEAMGGYNSMASFVHADPALASTDYVHFTPLGINLVAEMFYNALMVEYQTYRNRLNQE